MAVCEVCGTKVSWGTVICNQHLQERLIKQQTDKTAALKKELPSLVAVMEKFDAINLPPFDSVAQALPRDLEYFAYLPLRTFLTNKGILTYDVTLTGKLRKEELIPLSTITGIESKPPNPKNKYDSWTVTITRASNVDTLFSQAPEALVRDFLGKTQSAISGSGPKAASPSAQGPVERIGELKKLLDQGLISESEFNQKKAQILSEM